MKRLSGHAEGVCRASAVATGRLLRAVDQYPSWHYEVVRRAVVIERDAAGHPRMLEATLRLPVGPISMETELALALDAGRPDRVTLTRLPNDPDDKETFVADWRLEPRGPGETGIRLDLEADADVPRLVPLGDVGEKLAKGFVDAAIAALAPRAS
jgi:hypothetical protein